MKIKELYSDAVKYNYHSLILMIEFLIYEKKTVNIDDDVSALDLYFKPNNHARMNHLICEYDRQINDSVEVHAYG
ncbi:hypothetical protein [Peribacillus loiseleuriae]|uniref:Uncharacterized protein n=1 Tax=Peribacillus loiseleuriae TaxID=1679170 RepID=A0A0K9GS82_9BACI|nr:hypothetical protein [Peribacillus loiseleuriae]KMY49544.1 hypothetical protein AC625_08295 [Peribacillus loiseleuriae]